MYYKVTNSKLESVWARGTDLGIQYKLNEFVYADPDVYKLGYGLCVFNDLTKAQNFACEDDRIFECEIEDVVHGLLPVRLFVMDVCKQNVVNFTQPEILHWLSGTVLVRGVKLTKELKNPWK